MASSSSPAFKWRVDRDTKRGRLLRATQSLQIGEIVLREKAYANIVFTTHKTTLCAVCLRTSDPDICCDDCSKVFFCSEACQEQLQAIHEKECEVLEEVEAIAKKTSVDVDLLRLLIRTLASRPSDPENGVLTATEDGDILPTYQNVRDLIHAVDQQTPVWRNQVREGAKKILDDLPEECHLSVDEILVIAAQVNENSYSLEALDEMHEISAVGLFPISGLINHSCAPNCIWSNGGNGFMEVRALCDIEEGEEITFSYIDVNKERSERQKELRETKHFLCECERCSTPLSESIDRFLEGWHCPTCLSKGDDHLLTLEEDKLVCSSCQFDVNLTDVSIAIQQAKKVLESAKTNLKQRRYESVVDQLTHLGNGINVKGKQVPFHASHAIAITSTRMLADAKLKLGHVLQAYKLRQQLLMSLTHVSGRYPLPLALAHLEFGEVIRRLLSQPDGLLPPDQTREGLELTMRKSFQEFGGICNVCLAEHHPLRQKASEVAKY